MIKTSTAPQTPLQSVVQSPRQSIRPNMMNNEINNSVRSSFDHCTNNTGNSFYKYPSGGNANNNASLNQFTQYNHINNNINKPSMTVQSPTYNHHQYVQSKHGRSYRHSVDMCSNL